MPRIRQNSEVYAVEDFKREIRSRQAYFGYLSNRALAAAINMPHTTLQPKIHDPRKLTVAELRKIVETISPDPAIVLALLGYPKKECKEKG